MFFMFIFLSITFILFFVSFIIDKKMFFNLNKSSSFECGFDPFSFSRSPFSLRFFKLCMIFIVFDIEIVIILPSPIFFIQKNFFLFSYLLIILIIFFSLIFEWNQNSLNWLK